MGGAIAQELALGHPDLVRSLVLNGTYSHPDPYFRQMVVSWMTTAQHASSERELLEAFFLWIYSRRAHADGTVAALIDDSAGEPARADARGLLRASAGLHHLARHCGAPWRDRRADPGDSRRRGLAGPPRLSRELVDRLPNAELVVLPGEAHQPFQEIPEAFNRIVAGFWRRVEREEDTRAAA